MVFENFHCAKKGVAVIDPKIFRETVIRPVLLASGTHSEAAEEMLLAIAAHESDMGTYSKQVGIDDARAAQGFFMVEKPTEADIWDTYLIRKDSFRRFALELLKLCPNAQEPLRENPMYAAFMARMKLWREPKKLPPASDIVAMAHYWFDHYNGSPENEREQKVAEFISDYNHFVKGEKA